MVGIALGDLRIDFKGALGVAGAPDTNKPFLEPMLAKLETKTDINN